MRPCWTRNGWRVIGPPSPSTVTGPSRERKVQDRRVEAAGGLDEGVGEAGEQHLGGLGVGPDRQAGAAVLRDGPEVVEAVQVIGVRVGEEDAVEKADAGGEELRAQVGRGVDEGAGDAGLAAPLEEERAAAAAVPRICRVAVAPEAADARDAGGGAAAEDGGADHQAAARVKRRSKLAEVRAANSSGSRPRCAAMARAVSAVKAGSLRLPRCGSGREVGAVGLDEEAVAGRGGEDGAEVGGAAEGGDAGDREEEAEAEGGLGQRGARR